jgi:hypothetical protein
MEETPIHEQNEAEPKEILWEQKRRETAEIKDRLGEGIDENIKEAVTAFRVHEFATDGSCGGHLPEEKHGLPYPWVDICTPKPAGFDIKKDRDGEKEQEWKKENLRQREKMMKYLEEFYKARETPPDAMIVLHNIGIFGAFRMQNFGGETMEALTTEQQTSKLDLYRKEMAVFAEFLKQKFFDNKK